MANEPPKFPTFAEIMAKQQADTDAVFPSLGTATEKAQTKPRKRSRYRERDSSAVCFAFFAPYVWRDELDELATYVSEIRGAPPSRSETMRTALRLGIDQLRRQKKRSPSRRHEDDPLYVAPPAVAVAAPPVATETKPPATPAGDDDGMWKGPLPKGFPLPPDLARKPNVKVARHIVEDFLENG